MPCGPRVLPRTRRGCTCTRRGAHCSTRSVPEKPTRASVSSVCQLPKRRNRKPRHIATSTRRPRRTQPNQPPPPPPRSSSNRSMETIVIREEDPAAPAAAGGPAAGRGLVAALRELLELKDRRIQASAFFFAWGGCVVLHGTMLNTSAVNPEHVLAGYGLFTIGAALGFLTLSGSVRLGRAAGRFEEVLRGLFH